MSEEEIDDEICRIMQEHGPDGHVDGHEELTAFVLACVAAERMRVTAAAAVDSNRRLSDAYEKSRGKPDGQT